MLLGLVTECNAITSGRMVRVKGVKSKNVIDDIVPVNADILDGELVPSLQLVVSWSTGCPVTKPKEEIIIYRN